MLLSFADDHRHHGRYALRPDFRAVTLGIGVVDAAGSSLRPVSVVVGISGRAAAYPSSSHSPKRSPDSCR